MIIFRQNFVAALALLSSATVGFAQRQTELLPSDWQFIREDAGITASAISWSPVSIPHTWNALDAQKGKVVNPGLHSGYYRGACWYARSLKIPAAWKGERVFIRFEAASIVSKVYLNGELLGEHRGSFTAFCYELTPHLRYGATNELRVQVDNSATKDVPPLEGDFNMVAVGLPITR